MELANVSQNILKNHTQRTHVILLVNNDDINARYQKAISKRGVTYDRVRTLEELDKALKQRTYNGILLDIQTLTREKGEIKDKLHGTLDMFPVARLKWDVKNEEIRSLLFVHHNEDDDLDFFLKSLCPTFKSRSIRKHDRYNVHFNILLSKESDVLANPEKVVTVDVSEGGCYIYSAQDWKGMDHAWFVIDEFKDKTPICGEVRWQIPWGKAMKFPGIGIQFFSMTDQQREELSHWVV